MSVRVYVPVTSAALAGLVADRRLPGPVAAHCVTATLREAWPEGDQEQWEYAALMAAAASSRAARGADDRPRRYVVAADVPLVETRADDDDPTAVTLPGDLVWDQVAAALVDVDDGAADEDDLAWFASQEIGSLT